LNGVDIHTHYVFIEAEENENDAPLIYWSNGGPGASSLFGLLTELGPLLLSDLSLQTTEYKETGIPTPLYNPDSWTKLGSVLVFDAPAPVGFSYCNDNLDGKGDSSCMAWTDELASGNTYMALQAFYAKFPSLLSKNLFLTGESYAGIYIPTLARRILEGTVEINLQGFAVGDGCLGTNTNVCGSLGKNSWKGIYFNLLFMAGHGQMPWSKFQKLVAVCEKNKSRGDMMTSSISPECQAMIHSVQEDIGGFYEYSLYDDCTYRNGILMQHNMELFTDDGGALNDYACGQGPVMDHYLTFNAVQEALHIPEGASFYSVDNAENFNYTATEPDLQPFYKDVANGKYSPQIRILVYNGDTDPAITSFAAQDWTFGLGLEEIEPWRPWTVDGCRRMGGYVTRYKGSFDFLTIRGAGHMVPTYKPDSSFTFLKSWIEDDEYPHFDKECTTPAFEAGSSRHHVVK
jgi:carboxypeptidase C (cathepsin A)